MRQLDLQRLPREPGLQRRLMYGEIIRRHSYHNQINYAYTRVPRLYDNYMQIRPVVTTFQQPLTSRLSPTYHEDTIKRGCSMKSVFQNSKVLIDTFPICSICLNPSQNDITRELYCKHKFHLQCIDHWLTKSDQCPLCRRILAS
jgi:hypothetical protein